MSKLSTDFEGNVSVSEGQYYFRIYNTKSLPSFNTSDIKDYTVSIEPQLVFNGVSINGYEASSGYEMTYPDHPFLGKHFRVESDKITVKGYAGYYDPTTGYFYPQPEVAVTVLYFNQGWANNNTPSSANKEA